MYVNESDRRPGETLVDWLDRLAAAERDRADQPCGSTFENAWGVTHYCARPNGHPGSHYCHCGGLDNYTWPKP